MDEKLIVLYVFTWDGVSYLREQLYLSVKSLRYYNANVDVKVLVDSDTYKKIIEDEELGNCIDEFINVEIDSRYDNRVKSRILKTTMRDRLEGDFLFIDTDTIISDKLDDIKLISETSMVLDSHMRINKKLGYFDELLRKTEIFNVSPGYDSCHFNSGVIWCKDNCKTHELFSEWHKMWEKINEEYNLPFDQLPLNEVNSRLGGVIKELSGEWNCQICAGISYLSNSRIIHYYGSAVGNDNGPIHGYKFANPHLWEKIRNKDINNEALYNMIKNARGEFEPLKLISTNSDEFYIINRMIFAGLREIYRKKRRLFDGLDKTYIKLCKILRLFKKLKRR